MAFLRVFVLVLILSTSTTLAAGEAIDFFGV